MVWKEKRGYVEDIWEPETFSIEEEMEEENRDYETTLSQEIFYRRKPWWENQHWDEILDEGKRWGDLNKENQKKLIKLIGRR